MATKQQLLKFLFLFMYAKMEQKFSQLYWYVDNYINKILFINDHNNSLHSYVP